MVGGGTHRMGGPVSAYYTDDPDNEGRGAGIYRRTGKGKHIFIQRRPNSAIIEPRQMEPTRAANLKQLTIMNFGGN